MKPSELQRNISLLWFLHRHVTLKVHTQNFKMASRVSSIRSVVESTVKVGLFRLKMSQKP